MIYQIQIPDEAGSHIFEETIKLFGNPYTVIGYFHQETIYDTICINTGFGNEYHDSNDMSFEIELESVDGGGHDIKIDKKLEKLILKKLEL